MKTPIQELIEDYQRKYKEIYKLLENSTDEFNRTRLSAKSSCYRSMITDLERMQEQEKQFGFVCFEAGVEGGIDARKNDFDNFYKQYEQ